MSIPSDTLLLAAISGALADLCNPENWEAYGSVTPEAAAEQCIELLEQFWEGCMRVGTIVMFAKITALEGTLLCDGTTYDIADYEELVAQLDTHYVNEGAGTFITPDLRSKFPLSIGATRTVGSEGGEEKHLLTIAEMPSHAHTLESAQVLRYDPVTPSATITFTPVNAILSSQLFTISDAAGSGLSHENMPPFHVLNFGIYYK